MTEAELKQHIKGGPRGLYLLYGEESYLVEQYARLLARQAVEEGFDAFNLQRFDGQDMTVEALEEAVEALPLMAERKCVTVRDLDAAGPDAARLLTLIDNLPDTCVLVVWQMTLQPDKKAAWKTFLEHANKVGTVVCFERKEAADIAKLLVSGAKRRGCVLSGEDARYLIRQAGNDLYLLLGELDKLCALAEDGVVTRAVIDRAATRSLEAKVYDLSKAILAQRTGDAFRLLHQLFALREQPLVVLGALSNAYADLYRAKVAQADGQDAAALAKVFKTYRGKEWKLTNALRDARRLSVETLRESLEILAATDTALKSSAADDRVMLEQTVARLCELTRRQA